MRIQGLRSSCCLVGPVSWRAAPTGLRLGGREELPEQQTKCGALGCGVKSPSEDAPSLGWPLGEGDIGRVLTC